MPITVEDLAVTALVRILPRSRYRLASQTDARFQSFASNTTRIAYRQQGGTPAFLLFSGPGQNPHSAALAAASWAEANWRPNAIQRKVRPGVVVVHVAPGNQLTPSGPVAGAAVPATIWTVDSVSGNVETIGKPPGSPSPHDVRASANNLMRGVPAPSLGELDMAEKGVMQLRTAGMPPALGYGVRILLFLFALRYGLGGLAGLFTLPYLLNGGSKGVTVFTLHIVLSVVLLAGIVFGAALVFNIRHLAFSAPGFSSPNPATRNVAWGAYVAAMLGLAVVYDGVLPQLERQASANTAQGDYMHVSATVADDGSETYVTKGGDLTVDLTGWPSGQWSGVTFKSSNPSVLKLRDQASATRPVVIFDAVGDGVARVDASSADGSYTFQLRVDVGTIGSG